MSLRARLTVTVALIVALAVVGGAWAAQYSANRQLRAQADTFLVSRYARFSAPGPGSRQPAQPLDDDHGPFVDYDAVAQLISASGKVTPSVLGQPKLPTDAVDLAVARRQRPRRFRSVAVGDLHYRVLTAPLPTGGAVQIARSVEETENVLHVMRSRFLLITVVGTMLAAAIAWVVARRTTRPIVRLTQISERVAATQDLTTPIPIGSNDEIGRLAASFNTMLAALVTSRQQQHQLVIDASHELRTPLTVVRTNIEVLERVEHIAPDQRRALLRQTHLELEELTSLVSELVELATDARSAEPVERVDLERMVTDVAARFERRTKRSVTVSVDMPSEVDGRRSMLDRALSNLVDNALKYSPADTPVEIVAKGTVVEVLDRGPGIDPGERTRVFDRFYRLAASRTQPGSGLGLAIVKQVADAHHAAVSIESRPGGGSIARLALPGDGPHAGGDGARSRPRAVTGS